MNKNLNLEFIKSLRDYLFDNREMIEPLFDMANYVSFDEDKKSSHIQLKLSKELGWCGCVIGWGFNLCENPEDYVFTDKVSYIHYDKWAEDNFFLSGKVLSVMDHYVHLFISSGLWATDNPSLDFAIERLDMLLGGYVPGSIYDEVVQWRVDGGIEN